MTSPTPIVPSSPDNRSAALPAAQTLAEVLHARGQRHVRLPARFARAAALRLIAVHRAEGTVVEGPADASLVGQALAADQWALSVRIGVGVPLAFVGTAKRIGDHWLWVFPKHTLVVATAAMAGYVLRALEHVKPDELDASGRPQPWVPERQRVDALVAQAHDDDATLVGARIPLPPAEPDDPDAGRFITSADVRLRWLEMTRALGLTAPELTIARAEEPRHGLVTGRVWFREDFVPLRVRVSLCPNADLAEVIATLAHELAHPLSRSLGHGEPMKLTLVELAERLFGARFFSEARARVASAHHVVDMWVACGIRAALRQGEPPVAKVVDDGQLARILTKIKKLRELAHDQTGLPEAIAATATANDLITTYGLEGYGVRIDEAIDDQMIDRWVVLEDGAVWRRMLAHGVATYCEVFSLGVGGKGRMHFFGARADVIAAEYLYSVSAARIERECRDHLARWKAARQRTTSAETLREKTSFCDCAVIEFRKKLDRIGGEEAAGDRRGRTGAGAPRGLEAAEAFARAEHAKRGESWGSGGGKQYRENAAGRAAGRAMEVLRGVEGASAPAPLRLERR
ncbi:MAG: DUF2786 domain-containing protein [Deltaproteobacteria bacterium]|nr:DUF2786 domain-containing protein [Deltaproteobacteria bacterium]